MRDFDSTPIPFKEGQMLGVEVDGNFLIKTLESIKDPIFGDVGWLGFHTDEKPILCAIDGKEVLN